MKNAPRVITTAFALTSFSTAVYAGLAAGNDARTTLVHALVAMVACHLLAMPLIGVAMHAIEQHLAAHRAANPLPTGSITQDVEVLATASTTDSSAGNQAGVIVDKPS